MRTTWWVIAVEDDGFIAHFGGHDVRPLREAAVYRTEKAARKKLDQMQPDYDETLTLFEIEVSLGNKL